ncbi:hypothetical protein CANARDRAFT_28447 [[Candida] arabinofermentans NRRL YB-2248]|uniref:RGS domain-containing protein n=1 Tax=[Candida] arabinofermentans NRRL YB-2248 TaxID=983967 RepID=A0A1E4T078_9ASCO|nr:hypothetical protein CANARDRAFT_28447 [[Candida] arabinofermentans NRRL YB-2248]
MLSIQHTNSANTSDGTAILPLTTESSTPSSASKYTNDVINSLSSSSSTAALDDPSVVSIPKLNDVLNNLVPQESLFSKVHFVQFLIKKHCLENLEFYLELKNFILYNQTNVHEWNCLFQDYIGLNSSREINLPGDMKNHLELNVIPSIEHLEGFLKICKDYLHSSYQEFTHDVLVNLTTSIESASEEDDYITTDSKSGRCISPPLSMDEQQSGCCSKSRGGSDSSTSTSSKTQQELVSSRSRRNYSISSTLSSSTSTSCQCNSNNCSQVSTNSTWNKFGKKFKWRRASNTSSSGE